MHKFVRCLITEWRRLKLPFREATVISAVSGGADSVSLLLALHELRETAKLDLRLVAAHFNHHLRGAESDADEEFVRDLTTRLKTELVVGHGNISTEGNLEQNARDARFDFLTTTAKSLDAFAVVTGHTINDQAETFLLNLIRGSGPDGLAGMPAVRELRNGTPKLSSTDAPPLPFDTPPFLIRPLLGWAKRLDTEGYCHANDIEYRYDTMNEDTAFRRVRIRKVLIPMLEDMNPKIIETLANTASLMQNMMAAKPAGNHLPAADELILSEVRELPQPEFYDRIRSWLLARRGTMRQLQLKHIQAIERLALSEKSGRTAEVPGGKVIKSGGKLVYEQNKVEN